MTAGEVGDVHFGACGLACRTCEIRTFPTDQAAARCVIPWLRKHGWLAVGEGVAEAMERGMYCQGCLGDRSRHWSADCWILHCCVDEHRLESCARCESFPCERLQTWAKKDPSYDHALKRLRAIRSRHQEGAS